MFKNNQYHKNYIDNTYDDDDMNQIRFRFGKIAFLTKHYQADQTMTEKDTECLFNVMLKYYKEKEKEKENKKGRNNF